MQNGATESEYDEQNGILHVPRVVESAPATKALAKLQPTKTPILQAWNAESDRKLSLETPGLLDSLHFVKDTDRANPLPDHMMEVKVKAVGVNFRDLLVMLGRMDQTTVGFECAGIVTRVGSDCGDFKIGDQVVGCEFDTYRSYARLQRDTAVRIPQGISLTDAVATPINFVTAWHALSALANMQPGETVLIHSAAGGTGQAAVQVAQFLGATVIATVGSTQKRELIKNLYGVPDTHILSSRSTDFATGVKHLTGGQGADVVFNSLSGDLLTASWESIAPYGRFIEIGKRDIMGHAPLDMYYFQRNVTFSAIDVALMVKERPHLVGRALRAVMPLIASGDLKVSSPTSVYGIGAMEAGLRVLQGGQSSGKVVIERRDTDMVKAIPSEQQHHYFDPNATYVIAGGLGGLGRGIARWMVSCGARYLLLLSRSGPRNEEAVAFLDELAKKQVTALAMPCDITDRSMLEAFLGQASHCMPRIKGCIQATMVLKDAMFETMTYDQWSAAMAPKVQGTWNLHELLPQGLDFFIMLSSIASTMGNCGQANYAAANSFMDSLAHYRSSIGEKATALNLGLSLSAGVAAQSPELQEKYLSTLPFMPVTEGQLHALLTYHCSGQPGLPAQAILGLEPTEAQQRKGPDASYWLRKPAFKHLSMTYTSIGSSVDGADTGNVDADPASATTIEEATPLVTTLLVSKLSSLLTVEIRNWFAKQVKVDIAVFDLLGGATIEGVGRLVAAKRLA
ncbi:KR domain-containing protein [Aspergillus oleicola]